MIDPMPRMSRRKLLQIASLAPLTALLARGAGAAGDDEIHALLSSLPQGAEDGLWDKGKNKVDHKYEKTFRDAVKVLWEFFAAGARDGGIALPSDTDAEKEAIKRLAVDIAYEQPNHAGQKSGDLIASRSPQWEEKMHATLGCAYDCGFAAARAAKRLKRDVIDGDSYAIGYGSVEDHMTRLLLRVRSINKDASVAADVRVFAAGC